MSLSNKTVLVTGSTDGVGRHVALELGRQRAQVLVHGRDRQHGNCLHSTTYMATTMVREAGVSPASTIEEGAEAILNLAVSPDLGGRTGLYFNRLQEARAHPQAYDTDARARLRKLSLELTGLSP